MTWSIEKNTPRTWQPGKQGKQRQGEGGGLQLRLQATNSPKNRTRHAHWVPLRLCKVSWPQHPYIMTSAHSHDGGEIMIGV